MEYSGALRLSYHLQFFADEKTEPATAKKIQDTRKKGQVGKSQEFAFGVELLFMFVWLRLFSSFMADRFVKIFRWVYGDSILEFASHQAHGVSMDTLQGFFTQVILQILLICAPFFAGGFLVAALSTGLQFQFKISFEPMKPKLDKFNPINGLKRMFFSKESVFNLFLSIVKILVIGLIAFYSLRDHVSEIFILYDLSLFRGVALVGNLVIDTGMRISIVYIIVGIADLIFRKWKFKEDIKMSKQEVKDEYKDAEGDPQIKGQQRQRMREASQRRMMASVPQADVVITNPTHLAVAIKYDADEANAPIVVAKGEQYLAQKIKEVAKEHAVAIVENKPLARSLYATVDIGQEIPPELYQAVAEVLAVIYNNR
ncbi:MAG: flagellar biosynthesis protein FlhB [Lachnospiraceae bacterium]|nr:flagellar biosynthesis protein FlhB [Lachnospiraceae bacterium]